MRVLSGLCLVLFSFALMGARCSDEQKSDFPRSETVYVGGIQWGDPTTFNPLMDSASSWPCRLQMSLIYETLFEYDPQSGKLIPKLAESFVEKPDGIEVTVQPKARWNDGRPVTAWDVVFSYQLGNKYKNVPIASLWNYIDDVRVVDVPKGSTTPAPDAPMAGNYPRKVFISYKGGTKNPLILFESLQKDFILPRHILDTALRNAKGDIQELLKLKLDQNPVASGPYRLHSYSNEKIITIRDEAYWGNAVLHGGQLPVPKYVIHQIYKSNDHYSVALQQGRIDATSAFMPRIWLKARKKVSAWFKEDPFYPASSLPMLFINVTKAPLDDVALRRAMGFAINYSDIRELAVSGYSTELKPGLILPAGVEEKFFSKEDAAKYGVTFNPPKAKEVLAQAGYHSTFDAKGNLVDMFDKSGRKVPTIFVTSPAGWTDWEAIVRIVVKSMRAVGIDARERFVDGNVYWPSLPKGDFDLIMQTPVPEATPSQPWARFEFIFAKGWLPVGEKMFKNYGRFNNPASPQYVKRIDELVALIPQIKDEKALIAAYRELNALFMQYQPTLPLLYRPEQYYQFSTRHWENFATGDSPYAPANLPSYRAGTEMLWKLKQVPQ